MRIAPVADVKARFCAYLKESEKSPVVVTRNGKAVAVLLPIKDEEELERLMLAYSPTFQKILKASERSIKEHGAIEHDAFWRQVESATVKSQRSP